MSHHTEQQLMEFLASRLPGKIGTHLKPIELYRDKTVIPWKWRSGSNAALEDNIKPTEWLHICWLVDQKYLTEDADLAEKYKIQLRLLIGNLMTLDYSELYVINATWQQRAEALLKVLGESV
jgi:hypothetical protein